MNSMIKSTNLSFNICSVWKFVIKNDMSYPFMGTRLNMKKFSALWVKKRVNWCTNICSISSACLILIETLTELMEGSIKILSFSFLQIVTGLRISSGLWLLSTSISGRLCLSTSCEEKSSKQMAAVNDVLTAVKYGFKD